MEEIKRAAKRAALLIVDGLFEERKGVWRIMVPKKDNRRQPFSRRERKEWEDAVINIAGGWTIQPLARGAWVDDDGRVRPENMAPVDILCTDEQIRSIIDMTGHRFGQEVVLAYKISENVIEEPFNMYRKRETAKT